MQRIITYTILSGDSETSVLSFLRKNGFSKHILTTMKRAEHAILLNGHPVFGRTVLKEGMFFGSLSRKKTEQLITDRLLPSSRCSCRWISCMRMKISLS